MSLAILTRHNIAEATARRGAAGRSVTQVPDGEIAKAAKLLPAEVVSFYAPAIAFLGAEDPGAAILRIVVFSVGLVATPLMVWLDARPSAADPAPPRPPPLQYVLRSVAFVLWALATSSPLPFTIDSRPIGVLLMAFTMLAGRLLRDR